MPDSLAIAAFIFGAILILIAIVGGNFKVLGSEVSSSVSNRWLRFVSFFFGTALIVLAIGLEFQPNAYYPPEPPDPAPPTPTVDPADFDPTPFNPPQPTSEPTLFYATSYCSMTGVYGYGEDTDVSMAQDFAIEDCIYNGGIPDCCSSNVRVEQ